MFYLSFQWFACFLDCSLTARGVNFGICIYYQDLQFGQHRRCFVQMHSRKQNRKSLIVENQFRRNIDSEITPEILKLFAKLLEKLRMMVEMFKETFFPPLFKNPECCTKNTDITFLWSGVYLTARKLTKPTSICIKDFKINFSNCRIISLSLNVEKVLVKLM